jgi:hypothetical protein
MGKCCAGETEGFSADIAPLAPVPEALSADADFHEIDTHLKFLFCVQLAKCLSDWQEVILQSPLIEDQNLHCDEGVVDEQGNNG